MSAPTVSIVVPAYREAENLPVLIPRVHAALAEACIPEEILVVDDDSGDGTVEVCRRLAADYPLRLEVRRDERGLSSAVIHGLRLARGEIVAVMDADLSHPPEAIPSLVAPLLGDEADFVVGSRYVAGGSTEDDWGWFRKLNSDVATWLARPLTSVRDPMAGFFALRRETFATATRLDPVGYKIGLELLVKCGCRDVREVPIDFRNRYRGESKLSLKQQWDYLRHLGRLYRHCLVHRRQKES